MSDCAEKNTEKKEVFFDITEQYEEKIVPLAKELIKACDEIGLPYLMHFVCRNTEEGNVTQGILASAQEKRCTAVGKLMMCADMLDANGTAIPVPINKENPMSLLAALAIANLASKSND